MASINNAGCSTTYLVVTSNKEHEAIDETTNQTISKKAGGRGRGWAEYAVVWWRTVAEIRHDELFGRGKMMFT